MNELIKRIDPFLFLTIIVYAVLGTLTLNCIYFGDVIQQVSREAFWFYKTDFSSLFIPPDNEYGVWATGYHPPLMGIMTAVLWKLFGYELWVSHAFSLFWAIILIYNIWKLASDLFPSKHVGWVSAIALLEPALLTQLVIASPDFILFTAFVIALRGIIERKSWLVIIGVFFLCGLNMRGVFAGGILFISHFIYSRLQHKTSWWKTFKGIIPAYLPTIFILSAYFLYYFIQKGWFFTDSPYSSHYALPQTAGRVIHHLCAFIFMSVESGRFIVWLLACYFAYFLYRHRRQLSDVEVLLGSFVLLMNGVYFILVFTTSMPFVPRYFLPQFFCLTLFVALLIIEYFSMKQIKLWGIIILICFATGHLWIYPDKMVKFWDTTLAHLPFYELREECFDYIDSQNISYEDIGAGFCLDENQSLIDMKSEKRFIATTLNKKYFIYSNISNVPDRDYDTLHDPAQWTPVKTFQKWPVVITLYQKTTDDGEERK